jgi:hypothetical protein
MKKYLALITACAVLSQIGVAQAANFGGNTKSKISNLVAKLAKDSKNDKDRSGKNLKNINFKLKDKDWDGPKYKVKDWGKHKDKHVPEPSTAAASVGALALGAMLWRRARRRT